MYVLRMRLILWCSIVLTRADDISSLLQTHAELDVEELEGRKQHEEKQQTAYGAGAGELESTHQQLSSTSWRTFSASTIDKILQESLPKWTEAGKIQRLSSVLRSLELPVDPATLGRLVAHPAVVQGLLEGDLTKPLLQLSRETKAPTSMDTRATPLLQGHSLTVNNLLLFVIISALVVLPAVGALIDRKEASRRLKEDQARRGEASSPVPVTTSPSATRKRFSYMIGMLIITSYIIWFPAIFAKDFSFNIGFIIPLSDGRIGITQDEHHGNVPGPLHESTRSLIRLLWHTKAHAGAYLIAVYAFAVPVLKLVLLGIGELWRFDERRGRVRVSRFCILLMQYISKWAAPDMFAYVLLYYLIRNLQNLPVSTLVIFDIGFTCYSIFTLTCAFSSAFIPLPALPREAGEAPSEPKKPWILRTMNSSRLPALSITLFVCWLTLFALGVAMPCFSLHLEASLLRKHVPSNMHMILGMIHLEEIIPHDTVSVWSVTWQMFSWFVQDGDLNLLLGFVMIFVFVMLFTIFDMIFLVATAFQARSSATVLDKDVAILQKKNGNHPCPAFRTAWLMKHLSMLDVLIMGIIVCTLSGAIYAKQGIVISHVSGLYVLIAAEAVHYFAFYVTEGVAEYQMELVSRKSSEEFVPSSSSFPSSKSPK